VGLLLKRDWALMRDAREDSTCFICERRRWREVRVGHSWLRPGGLGGVQG